MLNFFKWLVVVAISIPVSSHLATAAKLHHEEKVHSETLLKTTQSWDGKIYRPYAKGQPEITILKITVPAKTKLQLHKHPFINAGVVTKGEIKVVIPGGKSKIIKTGEAIAEIVGTEHYGENQSEEAAEIIVFYAGIRDRAVTIKTE